jgi:hypothetical protein
MLAQLLSQGTPVQQSWESLFNSTEYVDESVDGAIEDHHINELHKFAELSINPVTVHKLVASTWQTL